MAPKGIGKYCSLMKYVSPNLFFLKFLDNDDSMLILIQTELWHLKDSLIYERKPKINKTYIVYDSEDEYYKRAVILANEGAQYNCWLIDYGVFKNFAKFFKLTSDLVDFDPLSIKAGLTDTVDVENFDFNFAPYANELTVCFFEEATKIVFYEESEINGVHYGHVFLTCPNKQPFNLVNKLLESKVILKNKSLFSEAIETLKIGETASNISSVDRKVVEQEKEEKFEDIAPREGIGRGFSAKRFSRTKSVSQGSFSSTNDDACSESSHNLSITVLQDGKKLVTPTSPPISQDSDRKDTKMSPAASPSNTSEHVLYPAGYDMNRIVKLTNKDIKKSCDGSTSSEISSRNSCSINPGKSSIRFDHAETSDKDLSSDGAQKLVVSPKKSPLENAPSIENKCEKIKRLRKILKTGKTNTSSAQVSTSSSRTSPNNSLTTYRSTNDRQSPSEISQNSKNNIKCAIKSEDGKRSKPESEDSWQYTTELPTNSVNNKKKENFTMGCSCERCQRMNVTEPEVAFKKMEPKLRLKPDKFLKGPDAEKLQCVLTKVPMHDSKRFNSIMPKILVHGRTLPRLNDDIEKVNFPPEIQRVLRKLNYSKATPVQSIGWPALMRNDNLCIVGKSFIGKTLTYVMPLCSFLHERKERYCGMPTTRKGPIAVVLANTSEQVETIHDLFRKMFTEIKGRRVHICYAFPPFDKTLMDQFKKPIDILVTTPISLLLVLNKTDLKRLCHLVIEDIDVALKMFKVHIDKIFSIVDEMIAHRTFPDGVQFMSTSKSWTRPLHNLIDSLHRLPVICIANPMQAALYGKADLQVFDVSSKNRQEILCDILSKNNEYTMYKCVVICKQGELDEITKIFAARGIQFLETNDKNSTSEISEFQRIWQATSNGNNSVLLCTDKSFLLHMLHLRCANFLVNYSLPDAFSTFVKRFSSLLDSYHCPFATGSQKVQYSCKIVTFIDDTCSKEFPKISNFFKSLGANVPQKMLDRSNEVIKEHENAKLKQGEQLCNTLKTFGQCEYINCQYRHIVNKEISMSLPLTGRITAKIEGFKQVNRFVAKLLPDYHDSKKNKKQTEIINDILGEFFEHEKCDETSIKLNALYLYSHKKRYIRCKISQIIEASPNTKYRIEGLDVFLTENVLATDLYEMPDEVREISPALIELYVAGIVPPQGDTSWSSRALEMVRNKIESMQKNGGVYCVGETMLQMENIVWIDDLVIKSDTMSIEMFSLRKYLKDKKMLVESKQSLEMLDKFCWEQGLKVPERKVMQVKSTVKPLSHQVEPQWAHLGVDDFNEVYFSSAACALSVFVKHQKYYPLLMDLERSIQEALEDPLYPEIKDHEVMVGKCCLAKDPKGDNYCRVLITDVIDETVSCFFVDYGDYTIIHKEDIRQISNEFITKLPFQAIECRLYGVEVIDECNDKLLDVLYDRFSFEDDTDFFRTLHCTVDSVNAPVSFGKRTYNVILLDYNQPKPLIINKVLLDCGFGAVIDEESLDDFQIPELTFRDPDEESSDEIPDYINVDDFELVYIDEDRNVHVDTNLTENPRNEEEVQESNANNTFDYVPMKASTVKPVTDVLTPQVVWHQSVDKVFLRINLSGVKLFEIYVIQDQIIRFCTTVRGKKYKLYLKFFDSIRETFRQENKGQCINITIDKMKKCLWSRLVESKEPHKYIKYDPDKVENSDDDDSDSSVNEYGVKPRDIIGKMKKQGEYFSDEDDDDSSDYEQIYAD